VKIQIHHHRQSGLTLVEIMVAILLLAVFVASIFEVNAVCLRYVDASKESVAAIQSVHDRTETLRNLAFNDLTTPSYIEDLMNEAPNAADFSKKATEVVRLSAYPTANGVTQFTRQANGTVTHNSTATDLGTSLVRVEVTNSWSMTFGGRARTEALTTIVSNGTKK
jgi:prepilin-type N-terminal cleavage/methylation domain-containing protein